MLLTTVGTRIPLWTGIVAALAGALAGYLLAAILTGDNTDSDAIETGRPHTGVVTALDVDGGTVCIAPRTGDDENNECHPSPGRGLQVGDEITYIVESVPMNARDEPGSPSGTRKVLVHAEVVE